MRALAELASNRRSRGLPDIRSPNASRVTPTKFAETQRTTLRHMPCHKQT